MRRPVSSSTAEPSRYSANEFLSHTALIHQCPFSEFVPRQWPRGWTLRWLHGRFPSRSLVPSCGKSGRQAGFIYQLFPRLADLTSGGALLGQGQLATEGGGHRRCSPLSPVWGDSEGRVPGRVLHAAIQEAARPPAHAVSPSPALSPRPRR